MPDPQLIQVKKYPNRRLYDSTRSRHLTHEELYELVVTGHTVRVTDSKSGADITNLVLMQALIERSPEKFASFPPELSHLMIRASEQVLRGLASNWFAQIFQGMGGMAGMGGTSGPPPGGPTANQPPNRTVAPGFAWSPPFGFGWPPNPPVPSPGPESGKSSPVSDLEARLEAMMRELRELKAAQRKGG